MHIDYRDPSGGEGVEPPPPVGGTPYMGRGEATRWEDNHGATYNSRTTLHCLDHWSDVRVATWTDQQWKGRAKAMLDPSGYPRIAIYHS